MNWYIDCWKKYATFSGRAWRKEYWMFSCLPESVKRNGSEGANRYGADPKAVA